ncbi:hypothetical protein vBYenPRambo_011 [Yersinia phage vB_YenP_Rambo]|uniref:Uncharacterized protein n=1 Tax=Yersinia phage vB_YenP_Rambo TaxID=2880894 RepID=A0AC61TNU0_9CAUD|nr:hypothetical protein vBYenPRambo_011 [Yersinia phage vB_YenP_Rambo]
MFKTTPPDDNTTTYSFVGCSEWCHKKWEEAIERNDKEAAAAYSNMFNQWKSRGE